MRYSLTYEYVIESENPAHNDLSRIDFALNPVITDKLEDLEFKVVAHRGELEKRRDT